MVCANCKKKIPEDSFRINCSYCKDFCDEICYMKFHDKRHGCINQPKPEVTQESKFKRLVKKLTVMFE